MILATLNVRAAVQPEFSADYVFLRWYFGHVEPESLPTFMPHPGDMMIYFKLQVYDQFRSANNNNHATQKLAHLILESILLNHKISKFILIS